MDRCVSQSVLPSAALSLLALAGTAAGVMGLSAAMEEMGEVLASAPRQDAAELTAAFRASTPGQQAAYVRLYFVDSLFIVCFALLVFSLLRVGPLPAHVKLGFYSSSIWLHPVCDWAENWVALRSFLQFMRDGQVEASASAYAPLSYIKWAMLAVNVVALLASLVLFCRNRGKADPDGDASAPAAADLQPTAGFE